MHSAFEVIFKSLAAAICAGLFAGTWDGTETRVVVDAWQAVLANLSVVCLASGVSGISSSKPIRSVAG